jgi:hypothetical protein
MIGLKLRQENSQYTSMRTYQNKGKSSEAAKENNAPNRASPELFPEEISAGYILHDDRSSTQLENVRLHQSANSSKR